MIRIALVVCLLASIATTAHAEIDRYAIIVGHNVGAADEQSYVTPRATPRVWPS